MVIISHSSRCMARRPKMYVLQALYSDMWSLDACTECRAVLPSILLSLTYRTHKWQHFFEIFRISFLSKKLFSIWKSSKLFKQLNIFCPEKLLIKLCYYRTDPVQHPELVHKGRNWTSRRRFSMQKTQVWFFSVKSVINGVWYLQKRSWRRDKRQPFKIYLIASLTLVVWHLVWNVQYFV